MKHLLALAIILMASIPALAATKATYPGGDKAMQTYLTTNLVYPAAAKANGVEGMVTVSAQINADGSLGTLKIVRMVDPDLEQEAIRLVKKMPKWTPATDDAGNPVASQVEIPVTFVLAD